MKREALVVCGPTAVGKSAVADELAARISETRGESAPTIVVDSMQVYREIPLITNQARERSAALVGIASVAEEWTVAQHKQRAEEIISFLPENLPFVLDAGTGMYLNALVLDVPLAPKVPESIRARAEKLATGAPNPRREARELELELAGAPNRGSIWEGDLHYDATFVYLRPQRQDLDRNISARSRKIARAGGAEEAEMLRGLMKTGLLPNPSVRQAIGVKEMLLYVVGDLSIDQAEENIAIRTRRLARRQMRWFDKLARSLPKNTPLLIAENSAEGIEHYMHDRMGA